jgi:hypothetical protein
LTPPSKNKSFLSSSAKDMAGVLVVALIIGAADIACTDEGRFQLSGGNTDSGRLEVCNGGQWGTVCSADWSFKEAKVACRQLGYADAFMAHKPGGGKGAIWYSGVKCTGEESSLADCILELHSNAPNGCNHSDDVGAACLPDNVVIPGEENWIGEDLESWEDETLSEMQAIELHAVPTSDSEKACVLLDGIPQPFRSSNWEHAYIFASDLAPTFSRLHARFQASICNDPSAQATLMELVDAGLVWNPYGMDLSTVIAAFPHNSSSISLLRKLYLSDNTHNVLHWKLDGPFRHAAAALAPVEIPLPSGEEERAQQLYEKLHRDGYVYIDDFGLDTDGLAEEAKRVMSQTGEGSENQTSVASGGSVITSRVPLPDILPLTTNTTINRVVKSYLGEHTVLNGYKITRLTQKLDSADQYIAGHWHHDRTGRRLKMFVFLHDVDCESGRPTEIAVGTNRFMYYKSETFPTSRFTDEYVQENFDIVKGCGKKGGGFLFDTHAIHRGSVTGGDERTTIILEYHNRAKCPLTRKRRMGIPCPSGDQYMVNHML